LEAYTADEEAFMIKSVNKKEMSTLLFLHTAMLKLKKFSEYLKSKTYPPKN